jgi:hypothetical protein
MIIDVGSPFFMYLNECEEKEKEAEDMDYDDDEDDDENDKNFLDKFENF